MANATALTAPTFNLAWSAGMLDGDGFIGLVKQRYKDLRRNTTQRLVVVLEQNCYPTLEHFRDGLEQHGAHGVIYKKKRQPFHSRDVYRLNFDGQNALQAISLLEPLLVRKRAEARVAMAYYSQCQVGRRFGPRGMPAQLAALREQFYLKLRSMK